MTARLDADEARLDADEARLTRDERRLTADEARLEAEEEELEGNREIAWAGIGLVLILAVAIAALVVALIAPRQDVGSLSHAAPAESVGTSALRSESVTADKLAPGAVGHAAVAAGAIDRAALGAGAVGRAQLARNVATARLVAPDALTGADIRERTLGRVPSASDAARLGGVRARLYVAQPFTVSATSVTDASAVKGPLAARYPVGSRVISGGAAIEGAARGAALVDSAPDAGAGWTATARGARKRAPAWRLVVTAICTAGDR